MIAGPLVRSSGLADTTTPRVAITIGTDADELSHWPTRDRRQSRRRRICSLIGVLQLRSSVHFPGKVEKIWYTEPRYPTVLSIYE